MEVHPALPERPEVFAEKLRLYSPGCRKLVLRGRIVGYGIAHPWMLDAIPPLDAFLVALPPAPQCLYIHDVAVLPAARGRGAAQRYVGVIRGLAASAGVDSLALVSVYGTHVLWSRFGFRVVVNERIEPQLASYGPSARYMVREHNNSPLAC